MSWLQLAIYLAIFAAGGAGGVKFHAGLIAQRDLAAQEVSAKEQARRIDKIDVAAAGHEADKTKLRTQFKTIIQEVDRVVEKPVYLNNCIDDDGLRIIRAAIATPAAASEPAPAVP